MIILFDIDPTPYSDLIKTLPCKVLTSYEEVPKNKKIIYIGNECGNIDWQKKSNYIIYFKSNIKNIFTINFDIQKKIFIADDFNSIIDFINTIFNKKNIEKGCVFISNGYIYYDNQKVYRTFGRGEILINKFIKKYSNEGFLPEIYSITKKEIELEKINYITRVTEWTNYQKLEIYKFLIKFCIKTYEDGLFLHDPHCFNVCFKNCNPIYLDFGSIVKLNNFNKHFLGCINTLFNGDWVNVLFFSKDLVQELNKVFVSINKENYFEQLKNLDCFLSNLKILDESHVIWSNYTKVENIPTTLDEYKNDGNKHLKMKVVFDTLNELSVSQNTLVDVGCNTGYFSFLAGLFGYNVFGFDNIPDVVNIAYNEGQKRNTSVTFGTIDIMNIPAAIGFGDRGGVIFDRIKSDVCLCGAVVHHLSKAGYTFDQQVETLSKLTNNYLLIEFIPVEDIYVKSWGMNPTYNIDNFINHLKKYKFDIVWIKDSSPSPRKWILAKKNS